MFLHPGRSSVKVACTTCHARINEECGRLVGAPQWVKQPSVEELRSFVEECAKDDWNDALWAKQRARRIMGME